MAATPRRRDFAVWFDGALKIPRSSKTLTPAKRKATSLALFKKLLAKETKRWTIAKVFWDPINKEDNSFAALVIIKRSKRKPGDPPTDAKIPKDPTTPPAGA